MQFKGNTVTGLKIAYIGGGSRGWAWGFMSDLAQAEDMCGEVYLYDIDFRAAHHNEQIGNKIRELEECRSKWGYKAVATMEEALKDADFVVISILPGTFDEMESDVHTPEKYGIYQSVGDTTGPGGIIRALRTIPMYEEIAEAVKAYCPKAWVISYTNPMTLCIQTLYKVFPEIKAFGCCHEVFGTQTLLANAVEDICGIEMPKREEIKVNVVGINHFTWLTEAKYRNIDLLEVYRELVKRYYESGYTKGMDKNWRNNSFVSAQRVKFDLFQRYGIIAAAGDRHLAEFCPGRWYLHDPECVKQWAFGLTTVAWRKQDNQERLARSERLVKGVEVFKLKETGEDGIKQIRALLGLEDLVTNVNIPNRGQIPNLPLGAVVETNASFTADTVLPIFAGAVPEKIYPLVSRVCGEQQMILQAAVTRDLELAFEAFVNDPLVTIPMKEARLLFDEMVENTRDYLGMYF